MVTVRALADALNQPSWFLGCYEMLLEDMLGQRIRKVRLYQGFTTREFATKSGNSKISVHSLIPFELFLLHTLIYLLFQLNLPTQGYLH